MIEVATRAIQASEIDAEVQQAIEALADIETRYERERDGLHKWVGPETAKQRLLIVLNTRKTQERQPLTAFLAEAYRAYAAQHKQSSAHHAEERRTQTGLGWRLAPGAPCGGYEVPR